MINLAHYADRPVVLDRNRTYQQPRIRTFGKPSGFWISAVGEDDWASWCSREDWGDRLTSEHRVTLSLNANIRWIESPEGIDTFHREFAAPSDFDLRNSQSDRTAWGIDWAQVAAEYDGIFIAPYQWSRRMDADWYYGWDCASGCVWNLESIASVDLVKTFVEVA